MPSIIPDYEEHLEEALVPDIEEGEHLAFIHALQEWPKKDDPNKVSMCWDFLINGSDYIEDWDVESFTLAVRDWTPFMIIRNGVPTRHKSMGMTLRRLNILEAITKTEDEDGNVEYNFDYENVLGRLVIVKIRNEKDDWGGEARMRPRIQSVRPFVTEEGTVCPVSEFYSPDDEEEPPF